MLEAEIRALLKNEGISDCGFSRIAEGAPNGLPFAISLVIRLSDSVIDEIDEAPTPDYFHHYRTCNAYLDRVLLKLGLFLQENGYRYLPVPASQSHPGTPFDARFSHKAAAVNAHLGTIGRNNLFLHTEYGARVRLATLFTNCEAVCDREKPENKCIKCDACKNACPSGAICGNDYYEGIPREKMFSAKCCSDYMKKEFKAIGRGAVCGICMKVCPVCRK